MPSVSRITFNSYSGPRIHGVESFDLAPHPDHWERVLWLTSTVESGAKFGAITMYDGTAVTAGLHQAIAVYPRELADEDFNAKDDQGSFFSLLRTLQVTAADFPALDTLISLFRNKGWVLNRDGSLRYLADKITRIKNRNKRVKAGDLVYGFEIREEFTPNQGTVPSSGSSWLKSKEWAIAFHNVFSDPKSFRAQVEFGAAHFEHAARRKVISARGRGQSIENWLYNGNIAGFEPSTPSYDLALAVFWSHSVNGPSVAYRLLSQALEHTDPKSDPDLFARTLLALLGRKRYGRWHHSEKNGRWQRTRQSALKVWDSGLFTNDGVMPQTL